MESDLLWRVVNNNGQVPGAEIVLCITNMANSEGRKRGNLVKNDIFKANHIRDFLLDDPDRIFLGVIFRISAALGLRRGCGLVMMASILLRHFNKVVNFV